MPGITSETMSIPTQVLSLLEPLVKQYEGCRLSAYQDSNGNWTIGWGHKIPASRLPCIQSEADAWLEQDLDLAYNELLRSDASMHLESAARQAALTDFVYNLGIGVYCKSTLHSAVLVRAWQNVKTQLALWVHAGGKVEPGLVRRRQSEIALIG